MVHRLGAEVVTALDLQAVHFEAVLGLDDRAVRAVEEGRVIYDNIVKFVRFQLSTNLGVRLIGIGPLIDSFKVERKGDHVTAQMSISTDELAHSIERAITFSKTAGQMQQIPGLLPSPQNLPPASQTRDGG
mgnify:CR=1 FL=1